MTTLRKIALWLFFGSLALAALVVVQGWAAVSDGYDPRPGLKESYR